MSETLKGGDSKSGNTPWDELSRLNQKYPDPERNQGSDLEKKFGRNYGFEKQAGKYRQLGDEMVPYLNQAAKKATGIRDGQDLGEYLHEKASWQEQIERGVSDLEWGVNERDKWIRDNLRDKFGERFDGNFVAKPRSDKEKMDDEWSLNHLGDGAIDYPFADESLVPALAYLAKGVEISSPNPDRRDREALNLAVAKSWMEAVRGNNELLEQKKKSPTYKLVERAVKAREAVNNGTYEVLVEEAPFGFGAENSTYKSVSMEEADALKRDQAIDGSYITDIRDTRLYKMVDKALNAHDE